MKTIEEKLLSKIRQGAINPVKIDIGCGPSKIPDSLGIDLLSYDCVDFVGDVFEVLAKLPDKSVDHVHSKHFFEHIADLKKLIDEIGRILKKGGTAHIITPHFSNPYYYSDPTHKTHFGLYTFCYYAKSNGIFKREVPTYKQELLFSITKINLSFQTTKGQYVRSAIKKGIEPFFNFSYFTMELYEEMFCYIFPCYEIRYTLTRI